MFEKKAEEIVKRNVCGDCNKCQSYGYIGCDIYRYSKDSCLYGLRTGYNKANEWHKVADGDLPKGDDSFGKTSIHRKIYLKDRHGNLYTGNYYPKDESHREDCFAVEFLDWGFQGAQFCAKGQISEWCEIPQYTEE